jgi:hypothetical protein
MSRYRKYLIRRSLLVVLILGTMGYLFGQVFLMFLSYYSANGGDPANQRVLWQTPLVMAGFGLVLTFIMEAIGYALRKRPKPAPVNAVKQPTAEELLLQIMEANQPKS